MGLKDYIAMVAAGGSLVFGWIASQEQLCDMRLAKPICIAAPVSSPAPVSASTPAPAAPQATNEPAPAPTSPPLSTTAPPPAAAPAAVQTAPAQSPLAVGLDLSGVPQAALTSEESAQFEQLVRGYLDGSAQNHAAGFRASVNETIVAMQPAATHNVQVTLNGGARYRILGACDNDCSAMQLQALDPNGALITSSVDTGDFPVLELAPSSGGQYTVRVRLVSCRVAPCFVGVRVLEQ
ncbi:MAG: hypothetical protein ACT4OF_15680 [Caulobacteraceae bacterium]